MHTTSRRRALAAAIVGTVATAMFVTTLPATADVPDIPGQPAGTKQYFATTAYGSDPNVYDCLNPNGNGVRGYCMVTSQDLEQGVIDLDKLTENYYPMNKTRGYFSTDGLTWSSANAKDILDEEALKPLVADGRNTKHLWAPSVRARYNGAGPWPAVQYYLYTPDLDDKSRPAGTTRDRRLESRIFVTYGESPIGTFGTKTILDGIGGAYSGNPKVKELVLSNGKFGSSYMSDPDPFVDHKDPLNGDATTYMLWANGDGGTCGDISIRSMTNEFTVQGFDDLATPRVKIQGFPASWGKCKPADEPRVAGNANDIADAAYVKSRLLPWVQGTNQDASGYVNFPYIEGASLYRNDSWNDKNPTTGQIPMTPPGKYVMVFAVKPASTPAECAQPGQPNTSNEAIAYATSNAVTGTYTYRGIIMCGSIGEFTNQATITEVRTASGEQRLLLVYHDAPTNPAAGKGQQRKVHSECMLVRNGSFALVTRTPQGAVSASGAKQWCLNADNIVGIKSLRNDLYLSSNNGLKAKSSYVGYWEQFDWVRSKGNEQYKDFFGARHEEKWVQVNRATDQVIARGTSRGEWEGMDFQAVSTTSTHMDVIITNSQSTALRTAVYLMTAADGTVVTTTTPPTAATQKNYTFRIEYLSN